MIMKIRLEHMLLSAVWLFAWPAAAQPGAPETAFNAGAGYRYDSNVNIAATDASTGKADSALLLNLGLDGTVPLGNALSIWLGYDYANTAYRTYSDFDLGVHHARAGIRYKFAGFDSAVSFDQIKALVDGERFLDVRQASPSLSRMIGDRLYLRGSYTRAEKTFAGDGERNAFNDALHADAYILIDGMQQYVALGYRMDSENAAGNEFDYDGTAAKVAYGHALDAGRMTLRLKMHLQFENRDYANITESIGAPRSDQRFRAGVNAAIPISQHFSLNGEVTRANHVSNLDAADFDEIVYTLNVSADF
jgi:hypothetical protein